MTKRGSCHHCYDYLLLPVKNIREATKVEMNVAADAYKPQRLYTYPHYSFKPAGMPKARYSYYKREIRDAVRRVKKMIDDNPTNGITTEMLANQAGISRNVLQEAFKQTHGAPIGQYRLRLRMAYAKQLLGTDRSIKAIAITLHYSSISAFCNAFKKYFGQSPTEWRMNRR